MDFKDYYKILDVPRTATSDAIKIAFRKLARLYHPDVAKNKATAEEKFKEINEANEVLSDPEKRRRYDELGPNWQDPVGAAPPPPGRRRARAGAAESDGSFEFGGTGFSDFFESFFGGGREGFGGFPHSGADSANGEAFTSRGQDIEADLLVTLAEALKGSLRKITLRRPAPDGGSPRSDTYQVRIKPGVRDGQRIRLAGQGSVGYGGGEPGDLFLRVRLARHPDFTVQGADLYFDLKVAPWETVLGVQAKIQTLDGTTSVRVPPGTAAGTQLRLRGLGLPEEAGGRGDLYTTISIQTPTTVSSEERALWEQLAHLSSFNPRSES